MRFEVITRWEFKLGGTCYSDPHPKMEAACFSGTSVTTQKIKSESWDVFKCIWNQFENHNMWQIFHKSTPQVFHIEISERWESRPGRRVATDSRAIARGALTPRKKQEVCRALTDEVKWFILHLVVGTIGTQTEIFHVFREFARR